MCCSMWPCVALFWVVACRVDWYKCKGNSTEIFITQDCSNIRGRMFLRGIECYTPRVRSGRTYGFLVGYALGIETRARVWR